MTRRHVLHGVRSGDALFRAVFELGPRPMMVWEVAGDGELRCVAVNATAQASRLVSGVPEAGKSPEEILSPSSAFLLRAAVADLDATGRRASYEEFIDESGRETWWLVELDRLDVDAQGSRCLLAAWTQIDFLKETELALHQSEASFQALVEAAPDARFLSRDGIITYVNPQAIELLGYRAPGDLLGKPFADVTRLDDRQQVREWSSALTIGAPASAPIRVQLVTKEGDAVTVELTALCLEHESSACILSIARDITDSLELQARLGVADRMVSLGTLAAGVAHEVNNPLAYVHGNLQWVIAQLRGEAPRSPADLKEILQALDEALLGAERVRGIALDLKRLSRAPNEALGPVDVARVLDSVINVASNEIRWRARLVRQYAVVPPVRANEARLGQLFLNLLLNATQAIAPGRIDSNEIRVAVSEEASGVAVVIRDTGGGIPPHQLPHLFDPFFTTKPGIGTGLGLSISKGIVAMFGGELTAESEIGRGSAFRVVLPCATALPVSTPVPVSLPELRARILVIDDEELVGNALRRMLTPQHHVTVVRSVREALQHCGSDSPPDVIICDVVMPEMTGLDFFDALSAVAPHLEKRVIFITGGVLSSEMVDLLERTRVPLLHKPIDWTLMDDALRVALASEGEAAARAG